MTAILVYSDEPKLQEELAAKGATLGTVQVFNPAGLPDQDSATLALGLAAAATSAGAALVMVGATKKGRDVAPRLAAHLDWPYASEAQELSSQGGWVASRMVLSGNSKATYTLGPHAVVTATPKTFEASGPAPAPSASVSGIPASKVKVVERKTPKSHGSMDLGSASVVVGVGRGFKQQADIKLAEELAKCFPGGAVGCSRPIAADLKWLGEEHWIGLSGHAIKPKAYIACGVSGQIQHIAGIRGAKLIIAINTNKDAPIFQVADYGVVGDLYQVLPKLTTLLRA